MKPKTYTERTGLERRLIGSHVRQMRILRSKSKQSVCDRLEIDLADLDDLEDGRLEFTALQILDLTEFLGCTIGRLLGGGYPERTRIPVLPVGRDPYALDVAECVACMPTNAAKAEALEAVYAILGRSEMEGAR